MLSPRVTARSCSPRDLQWGEVKSEEPWSTGQRGCGTGWNRSRGLLGQLGPALPGQAGLVLMAPDGSS